MRSLARWGSLPLLALPLSSLALGLGEIETNSFLNQPLNAEIPLTATPEELQTLRVSMAPVSVFTTMGLDYPVALNSIQFRVGRNAAGEDVIFVTSRESIDDPFLTMVVQATTSRSGVSNRELTVILDPPLFLTENAPREPITTPATRDSSTGAAGGNIVRETPAPAPRAAAEPRPAAQAQPQPQPQPQIQRQPEPVDPSGHAVQSGDTLWSIAERYRPAGVTTNQAMVSIFEANAAAFDGNINRLRRGAILRIPEASSLGATTASAATAEVRRQMDQWQAGGASSPRLVLIAETDERAAGDAAPGGAASSAAAAEAAAAAARVAELEAELRAASAERDAALADAAEARRLLEVQSEGLANVQQQAAADAAAPGEEPIFAEAADATEEPAVAVEAETEETPAPEPEAEVEERAAVAESEADEPSLVDRILGTLAQPFVWGGALAVLLVVALLAFLRRRRESLEDVTGQWEALEAEIDDDTDRAATARMRAMAAEPDMVVVEGHEGDATAEERGIGATAEIQRLDTGTAELNALTPPAEAPRPAARKPDAPRRTDSIRADQTMTSQTLSSQTVINLDQADPIAEADFHMAYGLYDQAADLISKALNADPGNRALKLKLLEVYFVWGNKEAFLEAATALKGEIRGGADWDKVVIMGKQICPDEPLFAAATASAGEIDLELESSSGGQGLDFAFDETEDDKVDLNLDIDDGGLSLEASGARARRTRSDDEMLDIGARTQAGLEAALLEGADERGGRTTPGGDISDLDSTMESPTVETRGAEDTSRFSGLTLESPTIESISPDAPTVETPTIESPAGGFGNLGDTVEQQRPAGRRSADITAEMTAEIALDDLGLDVGDLKDMSEEVIDLSGDDTAGGDVLSATGVTKVLRDEQEITLSGTDVLDDDEATMMAPGFGPDSTGIRTEVLEQPVGNFDPDVPATEDDLDLNLDDFSNALDGGTATVEQPMASRFGGLDLDVGADVQGDDEPTGTEEYSPLDPQTMTEVGTKLDLARAYIDMGDPEGAKSILEEVLSEGDAGQRSEAQALIDALPA